MSDDEQDEGQLEWQCLDDEGGETQQCPDPEFDAIEAFRRQHNLDDAFDQCIKRNFYGTLGEPRYHQAVVDFLLENRITWKALGRRLRLADGTSCRWQAWAEGKPKPEGQRPGWPHLFNYLVLTRVDPADVFPHGADILYRGIRDALGFVALSAQDRGVQRMPPRPDQTPDDGSWPALIEVLFRVRFDALTNAALLDQAIEAALSAARGRAAQPQLVTREQLRCWVGGWFIPWVLLLNALDGSLEDPLEAV